MYRIIWLIIPVMLLSFQSYSIELFGYKLYDDITQYLNDGDVNSSSDYTITINVTSIKDAPTNISFTSSASVNQSASANATVSALTLPRELNKTLKRVLKNLSHAYQDGSSIFKNFLRPR